MLPTSADDVVDGDNFPKGFLQKVTVQGGGEYEVRQERRK